MLKAAAVFPLIFLFFFCGSVYSLPSVEGDVFGIMPITNEVSLYKNVDDDGDERGQTVQIIAINTFKVWTEFNVEFTADFNWDMSYLKRDHYIELSIVKPLVPTVSLNYQRIFSSFEDRPVNQFGLRFSF